MLGLPGDERDGDVKATAGVAGDELGCTEVEATPIGTGAGVGNE